MKSIKDYIDYTKHTNIINMNYSRHGLESLEGSPKIIKGIFNCEDNFLKTLKYSPKIVGGSFICYRNNLETLEGGPIIIGNNASHSNFNCNNNPELKSLKGAPRIVMGGSFMCENCPQLKSLEYLPESIASQLYCNDNLKKGENLYLIANALINGRNIRRGNQYRHLGLINLEEDIMEGVLLKYFI